MRYAVPAGLFACVLGLLGTVLAVPAAGAGVAAGVVEIPGVPTSVAVSPSGAWVYVANGRSVLGIDASTLQVAWTTPTGAGAADVAVSPSGAQVYVGGDRQVTVLDAASGQVQGTFAATAGAQALAVTPDGRQVWALGSEPKGLSHGVITVLDAATGRSLATIDVGPNPSDLVVSSSGARAYVLGWGSDSIWVINAKARSVMSRIKVRSWPQSMALNPTGTRLLISHSPPGPQSSYAVTTINTGKRAVTGVFRYAEDLAAMAINRAPLNPGGSWLPAGSALVAIADDLRSLDDESGLVVVDLRTQQQVEAVAIDPPCQGVHSVNGLALSADAARAYVTSECLGHPGALTAVDLDTPS